MGTKMSLSRYAFIVKGPGFCLNEHTAEIRSEQFSARIVGVPDYSSALLAAQELINDGIQLIELCGGFTQLEADELQILTGKSIPIDVVK
jgi:Family of unknown function (DUF6506)